LRLGRARGLGRARTAEICNGVRHLRLDTLTVLLMLLVSAVRAGKSAFALASTPVAPSAAASPPAAAVFGVAILSRCARGPAFRSLAVDGFDRVTAISFMRACVLGSALVSESAFARLRPTFARFAATFTSFTAASSAAPPTSALPRLAISRFRFGA
jgi:hypothetical protein